MNSKFAFVAAAVLTVVIVNSAGLVWLDHKAREQSQWIQAIERVATRAERVLDAQLAVLQRTQPRAQFPRSNVSLPDSGAWQLVGGGGTDHGWDSREYNKSRAMEVYQGALFVGLMREEPGPGTIQRFDGLQWNQVPPPPGDYFGVWSLKAFGGKLFAGLSGNEAEVWQLDESGWTLVGAESLGSWPPHVYDAALALAEYDNSLVLGTQTIGDGTPNAAVFIFSGGEWKKVGGDGINGSWSGKGHHVVYELYPHDGRLFAIIGSTVGLQEVWSFDRHSWRNETADSVWPTTSTLLVAALAEHGGRLVASENKVTSSPNYLPVWSLDGSAWKPVVTDNDPKGLTSARMANALINYRGTLVVGTGGSLGPSVWALSGDSWKQIGGTGVSGSWDRSPLPLASNANRFGVGNGYIYKMIEYQEELYVGFGDRPGYGVVWRYRPSL